jgi:L-lactate dehydrogenase complex protein LldG
MNPRDTILARIREALRTPAARHDAPAPPTPARGETTTPPARDFTDLLPRVGPRFEDWAAAFAAASKELRTEFVLCETEAQVRAELLRLRDAAGWQRLAAHRGRWVAPLAGALDRPVLWTDDGYDKSALEVCDAGLTECDVLVAQTGTVVVTSASAGGRALTVLPPHHVVLARREQLVPDLPSAFGRLEAQYGVSYPSMISLITGPSRTGDIERILVLGAHGPKRLTVLCW